MKLGQRTPKTEQDEELSFREPEERKIERYLINPQGSRPLSAKILEKRLGIYSRKKQVRPRSAKKQYVNALAKPNKNSGDNLFLSRLRPTLIPMDKERLYEENMSLKLENNGFKAENMRIRTKLSQLEKEITKKDEIIEELNNHERSPGHKYIRLVSSLKQSLRELKQEFKAKEEELGKVKKNLKSSKINELEIEIQTYIDECVRLRHSLEEIMKRKGNDVSQINIEDNKHQNLVISNLKKEKLEILASVSSLQEENSKLKEKISELERNKKKTGKKDVNSGLKLEIQKLRVQIEGNVKENKEKELQFNQEMSQLKKNYEETKKKLEIEERKNKELMRSLENTSKASVQQTKIVENVPEKPKVKPSDAFKPKPVAAPLIFQKIHKILKAKNMFISVFISLLDKNNNGYLEIDEFIKGMKQYGAEIQKKDFEEYCEYRHTRQVIPLTKLEETYEKFEYENEEILNFPQKETVSVYTAEVKTEKELIPLVKESEVTVYAKHISFCMQLHRLPKSELSNAIFNKKHSPTTKFSIESLSKEFKNPPFMFIGSLQIDKLCEYLIQPKGDFIEKEKYSQMEASLSEIVSKLNQLIPDWKVFQSDEENEFDSKLTEIIVANKNDLKKICKEFDKESTCEVSLSDFKKALNSLSIKIDQRLFEYMTLLFYSNENKIEIVPYLNFIEAYGEERSPENNDLYTDEEKLEIIKHCLGLISQSLLKNKLTVREAFQHEGSLIYPEGFITGLEYLGLKEMEHEIVMLILEQLQYEKESENCIHIEEFEKIMENYGVPTSKKSDRKSYKSFSSKGSSDNSSANIKKLSIMESENFEYSEDSPDRYGISEISPFASVSNVEVPGQKNLGIMKEGSELKLQKVSDHESSGYSSYNEKEEIFNKVTKNEIREKSKSNSEESIKTQSLREQQDKVSEKEMNEKMQQESEVEGPFKVVIDELNDPKIGATSKSINSEENDEQYSEDLEKEVLEESSEGLNRNLNESLGEKEEENKFIKDEETENEEEVYSDVEDEEKNQGSNREDMQKRSINNEEKIENYEMDNESQKYFEKSVEENDSALQLRSTGKINNENHALSHEESHTLNKDIADKNSSDDMGEISKKFDDQNIENEFENKSFGSERIEDDIIGSIEQKIKELEELNEKQSASEKIEDSVSMPDQKNPGEGSSEDSDKENYFEKSSRNLDNFIDSSTSLIQNGLVIAQKVEKLEAANENSEKKENFVEVKNLIDTENLNISNHSLNEKKSIDETEKISPDAKVYQEKKPYSMAELAAEEEKKELNEEVKDEYIEESIEHAKEQIDQEKIKNSVFSLKNSSDGIENLQESDTNNKNLKIEEKNSEKLSKSGGMDEENEQDQYEINDLEINDTPKDQLGSVENTDLRNGVEFEINDEKSNELSDQDPLDIEKAKEANELSLKNNHNENILNTEVVLEENHEYIEEFVDELINSQIKIIESNKFEDFKFYQNENTVEKLEISPEKILTDDKVTKNPEDNESFEIDSKDSDLEESKISEKAEELKDSQHTLEKNEENIKNSTEEKDPEYEIEDFDSDSEKIDENLLVQNSEKKDLNVVHANENFPEKRFELLDSPHNEINKEIEISEEENEDEYDEEIF